MSLCLLYYFVCLAPARHKLRHYYSVYDDITRGMNRDEVIGLMGEPSSVWEEGVWAVRWWEWEELDEETGQSIHTTFRYSVVQWPFDTVATFGISFDEEGEAVGKHVFD